MLNKKPRNHVCKGWIWVPTPKGGWTLAQEAQYNEFVESGLEKLGFNGSDNK